MSDDAYAHKYVVDVPWDEPDPERKPYEPLTVGRVSTEDLVAQVNVLGKWHRRTPDMSATSCGILYHSQFAPTRREELCNPLCDACFTPYELSLANIRGIEEGEK